MSNDELFAEIKNLICALEVKGSKSSALKLRDGMSSVNGLTDGWASFLDSIESVRKECQIKLDLDLDKRFQEIHAAVYQRVYRKSPPWWKFW